VATVEIRHKSVQLGVVFRHT